MTRVQKEATAASRVGWLVKSTSRPASSRVSRTRSDGCAITTAPAASLSALRVVTITRSPEEERKATAERSRTILRVPLPISALSAVSSSPEVAESTLPETETTAARLYSVVLISTFPPWHLTHHRRPFGPGAALSL